MTRNKNWFKKARLDDLTWWINTEDYASEIEDKQSLELINWNFEGNKLVSWPGIEREWDTSYAPWGAQWITTDWSDIYHIKNAWIYKNWVLLYTENIYEIAFSNIDWYPFSISIDWVESVYKYWYYANETLAFDEFYAQILLDYPTYTITRNGNTLTIENWWAVIDVTNPNLIKKVDLDMNTAITLTIDWVDYVWDPETYTSETFFTYVDWALPAWYITNYIDGVYYIWREDAILPTITFSSVDRYTYSLAYSYSDTPLTWQNWDYTDSVIDWTTFTTDGTLWRDFRGYQIIEKLSWNETLSENFWSWTLTTWSVFWWVRIYNERASVIQRVDVSDNNGTCRLLADNWTVLASETILDDWQGYVIFNYTLTADTYYRIECNDGDIYSKGYDLYDTWDVFQIVWWSVDWVDYSLYLNIENITIEWTLFNDSIYNTSFDINEWYQEISTMYINKLDYTTMSISSLNHREDDRYSASWLFTSIDTFTITSSADITTESAVTYTFVNTAPSLWILTDDFYHINVSNQWILLTSYRWFEPIFIDLDWVATTIPISEVWRVSLWIVYNGKIVLWWYEWNDNIVFSQTNDPLTTANEMLNFALYDAWAQSVSWWNKWVITGFLVWENWLYVFKENEVWYSNTEKDTWTSFNLVFNKITSTWACNQNCIIDGWQDVFYFDYINKKVRRLSYEQNLTTLRDTAISLEVDDIFATIPDDDESTENRYSPFINMSFHYPYLEVNYPTEDSPYFNVSTWDNYKYRIADNTMVYNVENKSWAKRTDKKAEGRYSIASHKWFYQSDNWDIYNSINWNTLETWVHESKEYTITDDVDYKRWGWFEIVGDLIWPKTLEVEIEVDAEDVEIWETSFPFKRIIEAADGETLRFREQIDLYDDWRAFKFKLWHSWEWKAIVSDVYINYKPLKISQYYY